MRIYTVTWDSFEHFPGSYQTIGATRRQKRFVSQGKAYQYAASLQEAWLLLDIKTPGNFDIIEEEVED
jgi:hypothetical protein